jgi:hypothetical protein
MIKVKGIGENTLEWNFEAPPKYYRKVAQKPDINGVFKVEVYKLRSFNIFTKEAEYIQQRDEKLKSQLPDDKSFNFINTKKRYETED